MVIFNNKEIELYDLDSLKSIIKRIAALEDTLPEFIYFPNGAPEDINLLYDNDIKYDNLLGVFKQEKTFEEVYKEINGKNDFDLEKIVYYYIMFNPGLDKFADLQLTDKVDYAWDQLQKIEKNLKEIDKDYRPYMDQKWQIKISSKIKDIFQIQINKNKKIVDEEIKRFNKFQNIIGIEYTKFELENVKYQIELNNDNLSLLEIFNSLKLNKNIPFATTHYFYKILKDFIPFRDWSNLFDRSKTYFDKYKNIDRKTNIIFKVLETEDVSNAQNDFTEVILNVNNNIFLKLEHNINRFNISRDKLTNRILSILNIDSVKNEKDIGVKGIFYFPKQSMNKYIMLDLIMNDHLFSNILAVDETTITVKSSIFIHFTNPRVSNLTAYITTQKVKKRNPNMKKNIKNYDELFPLNSEYIRVKVSKCESVDQVKYFQKILSKLFIMYNEKYEYIIDIYRDNNIDLENVNLEEDEVEDKRLKTIDPYVFRSKYTRYCPQSPTYIEDDKVEEIENQGKKVITFPKEQIEDSVPKKYYCDYTKHIYPGLRYNPYKNANILPYIPCCYTRDQEKTKGSKFRNYYFGEDIIEKTKKQQQGVYVSNIIIPNDNFGTLPQNINKIFSVVDINGLYYRKGVYRSKNSFLNCLLQAFNINDIHSIESQRNIEKMINKIRKRLATDEYASSCKQEMYNYTIEEIKNKIQDPEEYLDPKLFIHMFEINYDCNIFLFSRNNRGELILPRHTKGYYKIKNNDKCVFIYEHMGGESDGADYPQCELIVRKDIYEEETTDYFEYNNIISRNIFNIFDRINDSYIFNKKIKFIDFDIFSKSNIIPISQSIDIYGKTRMINIVFEDNDITILTTPLQPYKLNIENITKINKINIEIALKLIRDMGIILLSQSVDENNFIKELNGMMGNINISIPIKDGVSILKDIEINNNFNYPNDFLSAIDQYNKYKKLSRYIVEYLFWLYSTFIYNEGIDTEKIISPEVLNNFRNGFIEIIPNFVYENVPKSFDINSGLMKDRKLVIKSEETLKRLFYVLRLYIIRNYEKIVSYYQRNMIENFYVDISDFDVYSFQVLLEGEESISKWISEKKKKNILHNELLYKTINPYFFRNKLVGNRIYLAQNSNSFLKAVNISVTWIKNKYNSGVDSKDAEEGLECTLYSYINHKNIKKYHVEGKENPYKIKIIGYKVKGENRFTSLLYV